MKFCFILTQDLESPSGLGRYYPWANELNKLGNQVEIIALHGNYKSLKEKKQYFQKDFSVHYVSNMHVVKKGNTKKYFPLIKLMWVVFIASIRLIYFSFVSDADIYIVGKPHPMNGIAGIFCKIMLRKFLIVDCDDDETNSGNFKGNWQKLIIQFFELKVPKFADQVTTNTLYSEERLIKSGIDVKKIYYLSNGVDPSRFNNIKNDKLECLREKLGLIDKKVIAYIGSMSLSNHAINLLIDAFSLIGNENKNYRLLMVGGGEDYELIRNFVNNKELNSFVIFTGKIHPDQVKYYYKLADVTVDPVFADIAAKARSPLKLFESVICEIPILTMAVGDRNVLKNISKKIIIVEDFKPKIIAEKIKLVIDLGYRDLEEISNIKTYFWNNLVVRFVSFLKGIYEPQ